jgi:hypothetical protein
MTTTIEKPWPELDYASWSDTLDTLHQWLQIVGKIRLRAMPWQNHSWHTSLYISPTGFTTQAIPYQGGLFQIDFDFVAHELHIQTTLGKGIVMKLYPRSVADFYKELFFQLDSIGLDIEIYARPNELPEAIPFAENEHHKHYDAAAVTNFWKAMVKVNNVFSHFRGKFIGKCSPVHLFWGAFDLAVTRFSGRPAPLHPGGMPNMPLEVMQEAYSQEVSSAGFWPGSKDFPQAVFYAYCYPTPEAFSRQNILPEQAFFSEEMGEFFLAYDVVQKSDDPEGMLMDFLQSTYEAAANTGNWDRDNLEI